MPAASSTVHDRYFEHSSANRVATDLVVLDILQHEHSNCDIQLYATAAVDIIGYAKAHGSPLELVHNDANDYVASKVYTPPKRRLDESLGTIEDVPSYARWNYTYEHKSGTWTFPLYRITFTSTSGLQGGYYLAVPRTEGAAEAANQAMLEVGRWTSSLHAEVWMFDQGRWTKSKALYKSIQTASWDDVVVDPATKADLVADTENFFDNRAIYEEYGVAWKRGIIFHGPPGNGKTISIKALMNALASRPEPIPSLYVKSIESAQSREQSVRVIFQTARALAPCLLIFEDLDSIVTDKLRSYFLNEIDGLENNDGILMIGSTNHLNRLDPAVSRRPSRFDRKYYFRSPELQERVAYARYWGKKLARNSAMQWQDDIAAVIGGLTHGFSFAYMKELFLLSLFVIANGRVDQRRSAARTEELVDGGAAGAAADDADDAAVPAHLADNALLRAMTRQAAVLRREMKAANETEEKKAQEKVAAAAATGTTTVTVEPRQTNVARRG